MFHFLEVILELGIFIFVALEWWESRSLNQTLSKVYRSKKRKDRLVKAIINAPLETKHE